MSKFTLGDIAMIRNELNKIVEKSIEEKLPAFLAFKFARLFKEIEVHFIDFEKQRIDLLKRYGHQDPNNEDAVIVEKEQVPEFSEQLNKLLSIEVEFIPSVSFKYDDFNNTKIDIVEASAILPFIKQE